MGNNPTLCQSFVASAIKEVRLTWPDIYMVHFVDDMLLAGRTEVEVLSCYKDLWKALSDSGLQVAPDKIQLCDPYIYLGFKLSGDNIWSQKITLRLKGLCSLNDFQKLHGDINCLLPYLKLSKNELKPLYEILNADPDPASPHSLTEKGRQAIKLVEISIQNQQIKPIKIDDSLWLIVCKSKQIPTALFWQTVSIMWIHLPTSPKRVLNPYYQFVSDIIMLGRTQAKVYFGKEPDYITQLYTKDQVDWLLQTTDDWYLLLAGFSGTLDNHYPPNKLIDFVNRQEVIFPRLPNSTPIPRALSVLTDGSANGMAAYA